MIGLVLVTHGRLADELKAALEHVVGPQEKVEAVSIGPDDDTPSNLAISVMDGRSVEVIAGVNLPMLVKLASIRGELDLPAAVEEARKAGQKYISVASQILAGQR
jgi:PTS system mannose-specific IIA component